MAEEENGQEKTEEATPKRLEKAREEGQVARSRELGTTLLLMTGGIALMVLGGELSGRMQSVMALSFGFDQVSSQDEAYMFLFLKQAGLEVLDVVLIILGALMIAGFLGSVALGGWLFSTKPLVPKLNRLDPLAGLKRMFSLKALIELFKSIAKFLVVAALAALILYFMQGELLSLAKESIGRAMVHATEIILWSSIGMAAATILISIVDVPFQVFDNAKKLRMTLQQVKDEFKDSEGKPEVKSKVRQLQRELAQTRMMASVPEADVVITNPEHFSVALKYDMNGEQAPVVVAKGADQIAIKIREVARLNNVPSVSTPILARAVYFTTEIDEQIPGELYLAVAQLLAFIFQLDESQRQRPIPAYKLDQLNRSMDVPTAMQFDAEGNARPSTESPPGTD